MLIKSLTRTNNPNFSQAIDYVTRAKSKEKQVPKELIFTRNFIGKTKADFLKEFIEQEALRRHAREGSVTLHHFILSLHQLDSKYKLPPEMYGDIANKFFDLLNDSKYLCAVHEDEHIHWHVLGSGVTNQGLANRLTRADFLRIKEEMQAYCIQNYYEYTKNSIIDFTSPSKRLDNDIDMQMNKRGTKSEKQILKEKVELIYKNCTNKDILIKKLTEEGIETYSRGKSMGIVSENGRHWRLSNFLGKDWETELSKVNDNLKSLESIRRGENMRDRIVNLETKNMSGKVENELEIESLFREGESMEELLELEDTDGVEVSDKNSNLGYESLDLEL